MLELNQWAVFHAVAQAGSVSGGAGSLMVSQPAVSKQIKAMERSLGTPLFLRHAKGVRLTPEGEVLAGYARRIFALADEAANALDDLSSLRRGNLSVGATTTVGVYLLPRVLVHFRNRFPGVKLRLDIESNEVLRSRIADGALDVGFCESDLDSAEIQSSPFMTDEFLAVAPPGHSLGGQREVTPEAFFGGPFISEEAGSVTRRLLEEVLSARGLRAEPVLSLNSVEGIKQAVSAGLGVAVVSGLASRGDIAAGRLAQVRLKGLSIRRPLYRVRRRDRRETKATHAFGCVLKHAVLGKLPAPKLRRAGG